MIKQKTIKVNLTVDEVISRLQKVTESWHKEDTKAQLFEGKFKDDKFEIMPVFHFRTYTKDYNRPVIKGEVISIEKGVEIKMEFSLPSTIKLGRTLAFIFFPVAIVGLWIAKLVFDAPLPYIFIIFATLIPIQIPLMDQWINYRIKQSIAAIRKVLK